MSSRLLRLSAVFLAGVLLLLSAGCGGEPQTQPPNTTAPAETAPTTQTTEAAQAPAPAAAAEATQPVVPTTKADILRLYTEVMNKAKSEKPAYHKMEYQEVTEKNFEQAAVNIALSLASQFMTSKEKAEKNPEIHEKGAPAPYFPLYEGEVGCMLDPADAEKAIEKAACRKLSDGNYEIVITLKPETDPEPFTSYHGQVFAPISRKVIDTEIEKLRVVKPERYSIDYHDCTATLVFNPQSKEIASLLQMTYVTITAKGVIDLGLVEYAIDGTAALENTLTITDFQY